MDIDECIPKEVVMTSLSYGTALPCLFTVGTVNSHRFPSLTNKSSSTGNV